MLLFKCKLTKVSAVRTTVVDPIHVPIPKILGILFRYPNQKKEKFKKKTDYYIVNIKKNLTSTIPNVYTSAIKLTFTFVGQRCVVVYINISRYLPTLIAYNTCCLKNLFNNIFAANLPFLILQIHYYRYGILW